jgi:16S rRNA (guanine527-N7)-methyltransferase
MIGTAPPAPPVAADVFGSRLDLAERYVGMIASTGIDHGLLGPGERPRIWDRHVLNCAVLSPALAVDAEVVDVGSGAGLPGVVLAIARPDLHITLVERLQRRTLWLKRAVDELRLTNVAVHEGRAESLWGHTRVPYVTARAVARLGTLAAWCLPLLRPGGSLLAIKGSSAAAELAAASHELTRLGASDAVIETYGVGIVDVPTVVIRIGIASAVSPSKRVGNPDRGARKPGSLRERAAPRR